MKVGKTRYLFFFPYQKVLFTFRFIFHFELIQHNSQVHILTLTSLQMPLTREEFPFNFQNPLALIQSFHPLQRQFIFQGFSFLAGVEGKIIQSLRPGWFWFGWFCFVLVKQQTQSQLSTHQLHMKFIFIH